MKMFFWLNIKVLLMDIVVKNYTGSLNDVGFCIIHQNNFKLCMLIPITGRYDLESIATQ